MSLKPHALIIACAAASWSIAPAALAQIEQTPPPASSAPPAAEPQVPPEQAEPGATMTPGATAAAPLDDKKIEQFAEAYLAVQTIQQRAATELQNTTNSEQADQVKSTAETDMIAAVERSGLKVAEFNQIVETMAADTEVRSRVAAELQKRSGGGTQ
jgi:uncharacterized protein DUF4168